MVRIVNLTPVLPPAANGLADFAVKCGEEWGNQGHDVNYIAPKISRINEDSTNPQKQTFFRNEAEFTNCVKRSKADYLLVHFSGYSYARWGLCHWLSNGIRDLRKSVEATKIATIFHEVYSSGPIYSSTFWVSGIRRAIARSIAKDSHYVIASTSSNI